MEIGNAVRELRRRKGWSQARLAKEAGLSLMTVFNTESDLTMPCRESFRKICRALGVREYTVLLYAINEKDIPKGKMALWRVFMKVAEELIEK